MHESNLRKFNLNTLPILLEILREQSLAKAAHKLNLTPSALSNCLKSLRYYFKDDLIVRCGREMVLTEKGRSLVEPLETTLTTLRQLLSDSAFDALHSTLQLDIAMTDHAMTLLAPPLAALLAREAPLVRPRFTYATPSLPNEFLAGPSSFMVGSRAALIHRSFSPDAMSKMRLTTLWQEPYVSIAPASDDRWQNGISPEDFLTSPHILFNLAWDSQLGEMIAEQCPRGTQGKAIEISSLQALPELVARTECLAIVPKSVAIRSMNTHAIQLIDPPFALPPYQVILAWRESDDRNPGLLWVRNAIIDCAKQLDLQADDR